MEPARSYTDPFKADIADIQEVDAEARSLLVSNVAYTLALHLSKGSHYSGKATISFDCSTAAPELWLDFKADQILYFSINRDEPVPRWERSKLYLPGLVKGANSAVVHFINAYGHDGTGIHHFTDRADGEEYVYTQFESPYAHLAFPCFDQPDLKATLDLTVVAPAGWKVIANERGEVQEWHRTSSLLEDVLAEGEYRQHVFRQTKRISTYLFAVCAGPYAEWRNESNDSGVPLGLYCRKSLSKYCNPDLIFHWTVNGFRFYSEFFGVNYPFNKYDQVYVPEFKFGAMENVGCVTYRDEFVFRDRPSAVMLVRVCYTFLHEMAHTWFGNLVTMKWWEDLWLNESFATYISHVCQARQLPTEFPNVWNEFLTRKERGYNTDQLSTTHSISVKVNHTGETNTLFDGISYSKGSSVLKQLHYIIGDDVFKAAMQEYIQSNQYKNTVYQDLISIVSKHAKRAGIPVDIDHWSDLWVKTAGLNQLEASFGTANGKITHFAIKQSAVLPQHPTLRPHKILVELYGEDMSVLWTGPLIVQPQTETVYADFVGRHAPSCVLLNAEDHDFAKIVVDPVSLPFLQGHITAIPSSLTKQVILRAIWDMVRDSRYPGVDFLDLVVRLVNSEPDLAICNYLLELSVSAIMHYLPGCTAKKAYASQVFAVVMNRIKHSSSLEETILFQKKLLLLLLHPCDIVRAKDWLTEQTDLPFFTLGQNDRWTILAAYASISSLARELVEEESKRDNTSAGRNFHLYCEGLYPDPTSKEAMWTRLTTETANYSNYELEYMTKGFNHWSHTWLLHPYFHKYSEVVPRLLGAVDKELGRIVVCGLLPRYAEDDMVVRLIEDLLPVVPEDRVEVVRMLKEERDSYVRLSKGRALSYRRLYD